MKLKCKCCLRETNDLRFGFCFDCVDCESVLVEGVNMFDEIPKKEDDLSLSMSKLRYIIKKYIKLNQK